MIICVFGLLFLFGAAWGFHDDEDQDPPAMNMAVV